ncbi:hypothetical protein [Rhodoferax sp. GW822-FHT02A01]|uniref:hypothetical protein n=1 Tax=Rhodoferax sp. GW822-FHT02A01 TaxID=3141537 RepID=UPI00315DD40D
MEKKNFLMLLSLTASNAAVGKAVIGRLKEKVDPAASPLWIDSRGVGVFITTDLPVYRIWYEAFPDNIAREDQMTMKNVVLVQIGPDWYAGDNQTTYGAWLNSRFPKN